MITVYLLPNLAGGVIKDVRSNGLGYALALGRDRGVCPVGLDHRVYVR